jgi:hypothetical protein
MDAVVIPRLGDAARLDLGLLAFRIALLGCGDDRSIDPDLIVTLIDQAIAVGREIALEEHTELPS